MTLDLSGLASFTIVDETKWQEYIDANQNEYGKLTFEFLARWANLMEQRMADGAELEDIADETLREADTVGITGNVYACAVQTLGDVWEHGERLRSWSNAQWLDEDDAKRYDEAGAVFNPAVMTFTVGGT